MAKSNVNANLSNTRTANSTETKTYFGKKLLIIQKNYYLQNMFISDKCGLFIVVTTVIIILTIVVTGVFVKFFVAEPASSIILITLICFLFVLGVISLTVLEIRRRRYKNAVIVRNGKTYHNIQPSAPLQESSWEYSNRTTMPVS